MTDRQQRQEIEPVSEASDYQRNRGYFDWVREQVFKIMQREPRARSSDNWIFLEYARDHHRARVERGRVTIDLEDFLAIPFAVLMRRRQEINEKGMLLSSDPEVLRKRGKRDLVKPLDFYEKLADGGTA